MTLRKVVVAAACTANIVRGEALWDAWDFFSGRGCGKSEGDEGAKGGGKTCCDTPLDFDTLWNQKEGTDVTVVEATNPNYENCTTGVKNDSPNDGENSRLITLACENFQTNVGDVTGAALGEDTEIFLNTNACFCCPPKGKSEL